MNPVKICGPKNFSILAKRGACKKEGGGIFLACVCVCVCVCVEGEDFLKVIFNC